MHKQMGRRRCTHRSCRPQLFASLSIFGLWLPINVLTWQVRLNFEQQRLELLKRRAQPISCSVNLIPTLGTPYFTLILRTDSSSQRASMRSYQNVDTYYQQNLQSCVRSQRSSMLLGLKILFYLVQMVIALPGKFLPGLYGVQVMT
jgi:hypothetical protein